MERIMRSLPAIGFAAVLGLLAYQQFNPIEQAKSHVHEVSTEFRDAVAERIESLETELAHYKSQLIQERVVDLPDDSGAWQTVLVYPSGDKSDEASRRLAANFATTPRLQSLTAQTKVYELYPGHAHYWWVQRYHASSPLPAVMLLKPDGQAVYKASGANIPLDGEQLASEIAVKVEDCRPGPKPTPTPTPTPGPIPDLRPDIGPDVGPDQPAKDDELSWLAYALIAASGVGGAYFAQKREG